MGTDQAGDRRAPVSRRGELTCVGPRLCDKPSKLAVLPTQLPRSDFAAQWYLPRPPAVAIHANKSAALAPLRFASCGRERPRLRFATSAPSRNGSESALSDPLPSAPAKVGLLTRQPTLGSGDGDYSLCLAPKPTFAPDPGIDWRRQVRVVRSSGSVSSMRGAGQLP